MDAVTEFLVDVVGGSHVVGTVSVAAKVRAGTVFKEAMVHMGL